MEVLVAPHPLVERCRRCSCIVPCIVRGHVKQIIATGLRVSLAGAIIGVVVGAVLGFLVGAAVFGSLSGPSRTIGIVAAVVAFAAGLSTAGAVMGGFFKPRYGSDAGDVAAGDTGPSGSPGEPGKPEQSRGQVVVGVHVDDERVISESQSVQSAANRCAWTSSTVAAQCSTQRRSASANCRCSLAVEGCALLRVEVALADMRDCVVEEHTFGAGRWGVTSPDQRIEAALRLIPGRLVERATYPPRTGHRNRWPVRHRGSQMRRKTLTGDRTTSGFQVPKTVRRAGESLSRVLPHLGTVREQEGREGTA
jgi:hypothetical protein